MSKRKTKHNKRKSRSSISASLSDTILSSTILDSSSSSGETNQKKKNKPGQGRKPELTTRNKRAMLKLQSKFPELIDNMLQIALPKPIPIRCPACKATFNYAPKGNGDREMMIHLDNRLQGKPRQITEVDIFANVTLSSTVSLRLLAQVDDYKREMEAIDIPGQILKVTDIPNPLLLPEAKTSDNEANLSLKVRQVNVKYTDNERSLSHSEVQTNVSNHIRLSNEATASENPRSLNVEIERTDSNEAKKVDGIESILIGSNAVPPGTSHAASTTMPGNGLVIEEVNGLLVEASQSEIDKLLKAIINSNPLDDKSNKDDEFFSEGNDE